MAIVLDPEILEDDLAVSVACVVAAANKRATEMGADVRQSIVTVTQMTDDEPRWRVNYGRKDYVGWQGGDLVVNVDVTDASIKQVLKGQ